MNAQEKKEVRSLEIQKHFQLDKIYFATSNTALIEAKKAFIEIEEKIKELKNN